MISPRMFNATCTIARPTLSKQSSGAYARDANATIYTGLTCTVQPDSSSLVVEQKQARGVKGATLYLPPTTAAGSAVSVRAEDVVTVGSDTWKAAGPSIDASAGRGVLLRVPLEAPLVA